MLLQAAGIIKNYGVRTVLSNISMQIQERERIGLVGVNGAGKSTLMKILAGELSFDAGNIFKPKELRIGYLAQNSGLKSDKTIWDEMLTVFSHLLDVEQELRELESRMADPGLAAANPKTYEEALHRYATRSDWFKEQGGYEMEAKVRGVLHGMGFADMPHNTLIHTLSGGQKTRLALAKLLLQTPDILMLDEPTNHLDIPTLTWLESYLRTYPGAILVISHDRYFLDAIVGAIYEIERMTCKRYTGNYSKYIETKAAEYEAEMKKYEKQQDQIARLEDFVQRNIVRASTTKRAQSRRKMLERMDRMDKPLGDLKRASFTFEVERMTGKDVLRVEDLAVSYPNRPPLFAHLSVEINRGETVALIGPNGIGKSTLLKTLIGQQAPLQGHFQWGTHVKIGYYDQEQADLTSANTVLEEVWSAYPHIEEARIRTVLGNFLFSGEDVLKRISALSGGEKARVALAKLMLLKANVLILDEPTNHLDLYSKEVLEASLMDFEGTLLFISHDRYFLNKMAERIIELTPRGANHFLGNYDDYLEKQQDFVAMEAEKQQGKLENDNKSPVRSISQQAESPVNDYEAEKQAKREERTRQRKTEALEQYIAELEQQIAELESELSKPEVFQDYVRVQDLQMQIEAAKNSLQQSYEAWEALLS